MEEKKRSEKNVIHEKQEPHDAAHCHINNPVHSRPDMDCGHTVEGPGPGHKAKKGPVGPGVGLN